MRASEDLEPEHARSLRGVERQREIFDPVVNTHDDDRVPVLLHPRKRKAELRAGVEAALFRREGLRASRALLGFDSREAARPACACGVECTHREAAPGEAVAPEILRFEVAIRTPPRPKVLARRVGGEVAERVLQLRRGEWVGVDGRSRDGGGRGEDGGESIEEAHGQILRERGEEAPIGEAMRGPRVLEHVDEL